MTLLVMVDRGEAEERSIGEKVGENKIIYHRLSNVLSPLRDK